MAVTDESALASIMAEAFDSIDLAVLVLDADFQIVFVNDGYHRLFDLDAEVCQAGANFVDVVWILTDRGEFGAGEAGAVVDERLKPIRERGKVRLVRQRPNGRMLAETGAPLAGGGYTYSFSDVTDEHLAAERLKAANRATVQALADLAEFRDNDTGDHVVRVARMTHEITRVLDQAAVFSEQISPAFRSQIGVASILHDVGKVAIADGILRKPGPLDPAERITMQEHAAAGAAILGKALVLAPDSTYLRIAADVARHHHERYDGEGYPDRLAGERIPLAARIVAVADVFDALISDRPYKQPWSDEKAQAYLAAQAGTQFDPQVIAAALSVIAERQQTPVIRWTEAMSVKDATLDRDHRTLIALVNQLSLPANREDHTVLEFVLDELLDYTIAHFGREEAHMRRIGFADCDRHEAIHRQLTSELLEIRTSFAAGGRDLGDKVATFTADWLRNHIMREDRRYVG